jgi:hypothetical protein
MDARESTKLLQLLHALQLSERGHANIFIRGTAVINNKERCLSIDIPVASSG